MYNFDLGWTSQDGPNVFALGWLSRFVTTVDLSIIPCGGMDDSLIRTQRIRKKRTRQNIKNLLFMTLLFMAAQEGDYGPIGREENETDTPD